MKNNAVRATNLIGKHTTFFLDQFLAGVVFELGELANYFDETI